MHLKPLQPLLFFLIFACSLSSCGGLFSEMGSQDPENKRIIASEDGAKIVRLYSVFFVTSYKKTGGMTQRHGSSEYFIEVYDGATGAVINTSPFKLKSNCDIFAVTDKAIWMNVFSTEEKRFQLQVRNINDGKLLFDEQSIADKNNGLHFQSYRPYYNTGQYQGIILKADDARIYNIDETTGLATLIPDSVKVKLKRGEFEKISSFRQQDQYVRFNGSQRKRMVVELKGSKDITSTIDFIDPYILDETPRTYQGNYIVLSKTKANNSFEYQFNLLDTATLESKWETVLTGIPGNDLLDISLNKNGILILTKYSFGLIAPQTGKWIFEKKFPIPKS